MGENNHSKMMFIRIFQYTQRMKKKTEREKNFNETTCIHLLDCITIFSFLSSSHLPFLFSSSFSSSSLSPCLSLSPSFRSHLIIRILISIGDNKSITFFFSLLFITIKMFYSKLTYLVNSEEKKENSKE